MSWNLILAFLGLLFGYTLFTSKKRSYKVISALLWLLFIPNTIYVITDLKHLPEQWEELVSLPFRTVLIFQYSVLIIFGVLMFIGGLYFFEKTLFAIKINSKSVLDKRFIVAIIIGINFLIGVGIIMGRVQRTNSWEIFTQIRVVISDMLVVLTSIKYLMYVMLFGVLNNVVYFNLRKTIGKLICYNAKL